MHRIDLQHEENSVPEPWPITVVPVSSLTLDPANVRIRSVTVGETAILNYLYLNDDVDELAHGILRDGYIDNEIPVVLKSSTGYTVMEGNRRVSALKGLLNPSAVPARQQNLERLLRRYPGNDVPDEIRVMVAPDVDSVMPLLARLHTGHAKKGWPREQQAAFYAAQLEGGLTVAELKQAYPIAPGQITKFIRMAQMSNLLRDVTFDDPSLAAWARSDLKMTSFEYAYSKPGIQDALGISFTSDGLLENHAMSPGLQAGIIFLIEGFRSKALSTRAPQLRTNDPLYKRFVDDLKAIVDNGSSEELKPKDSTKSSSATGESKPDPTIKQGKDTGNKEGSNASKVGITRRRQTNRLLDFSSISYRSAAAGLQRRYEELSRLDLNWYPNAAYDLLRTVLECTIKNFFEVQPHNPLSSQAQLGECIRHLLTHFKKSEGEQNMVRLITALNQRGSGLAEQFIGTAEALNHLNHNQHAFVVRTDVHAGWDHMVPVLSRLLEEIGGADMAS